MAREMNELDCAYRVRVEFDNPHRVHYFGPFTGQQARNIRTRFLNNWYVKNGHQAKAPVSAEVEVSGDWTTDKA